MNKNLAVEETANDELLLDQLVQDLFLEHLRRELDVQRKSIDSGNDLLFNLDRKLGAEFKKLIGPIETICDTLGEQTRELNDAKDDAQTHYRTLLNSLAQNRTDIAALDDILRKYYQEQGEQLQRTQEKLFQQNIALQAQTTEMASLMEQQFSTTLDGMHAQNVVLASLAEQNDLLNQKLIAMEEKHLAGMSKNLRWGKCATGSTVINMLILVCTIAAFIIHRGV